MGQKTSTTSYQEFTDWATERMFDALMTGGFGELRTVFRTVIVQSLLTIAKEGGFRK